MKGREEKDDQVNQNAENQTADFKLEQLIQQN